MDDESELRRTSESLVATRSLLASQREELVWLKEEYQRQKAKTKKNLKCMREEKSHLEAQCEALELRKQDLVAEMDVIGQQGRDGKHAPASRCAATVVDRVDDEDLRSSRNLVHPEGRETRTRARGLSHLSVVCSSTWTCIYCHIENSHLYCRACSQKNPDPNFQYPADDGCSEASPVSSVASEVPSPEEEESAQDELQRLRDKLEFFSQIMFSAYATDSTARETRELISQLNSVEAQSAFFHAIHGLKLKNLSLRNELVEAEKRADGFRDEYERAMEYVGIPAGERPERSAGQWDELERTCSRLEQANTRLTTALARERRDTHRLKQERVEFRRRLQVANEQLGVESALVELEKVDAAVELRVDSTIFGAA